MGLLFYFGSPPNYSITEVNQLRASEDLRLALQRSYHIFLLWRTHRPIFDVVTCHYLPYYTPGGPGTS